MYIKLSWLVKFELVWYNLILVFMNTEGKACRSKTLTFAATSVTQSTYITI